MTYSVGLLGVSPIGVRHRNGFERVDGIEVVAIADVDGELLAERGAQWDIDPAHQYDTHEALLANEDLDVVSVATPTYLHRDHVIDAAESTAAPSVIWGEKPIATSVSAAEEMLEVTNQAGVELVINHSRRFGTSYQTLRKLLLDDQLLGDIHTIHITGPEELLRNGTHAIDLAYYLLEERVDWGFGYLTDHSDSMDRSFDDSGGAGMLLTENETYLDVDHTVPRGENASTWLFIGSEGKLYFDQTEEARYWRLEDSAEGGYGTTHVETALPTPLGEPDDIDDMFLNGARHIVDLLDGTAVNLSPGDEATHVLEIIVALFVAHYTRSAVELPLARPLRDVGIRSR